MMLVLLIASMLSAEKYKRGDDVKWKDDKHNAIVEVRKDSNYIHKEVSSITSEVSRQRDDPTDEELIVLYYKGTDEQTDEITELKIHISEGEKARESLDRAGKIFYSLKKGGVKCIQQVREWRHIYDHNHGSTASKKVSAEVMLSMDNFPDGSMAKTHSELSSLDAGRIFQSAVENLYEIHGALAIAWPNVRMHQTINNIRPEKMFIRKGAQEVVYANWDPNEWNPYFAHERVISSNTQVGPRDLAYDYYSLVLSFMYLDPDTKKIVANRIGKHQDAENTPTTYTVKTDEGISKELTKRKSEWAVFFELVSSHVKKPKKDKLVLFCEIQKKIIGLWSGLTKHKDCI